jgi:hypothetical protein
MKMKEQKPEALGAGPRTGALSGAVAASALLLAACSSPAPGTRLPSFNDVATAPAVIQTAARAVVRVHTADEYATGCFLSPTGLLLTNNHVLGDTVCPREGCHVAISLMHQVGEPVQDPMTVFAVPVAVDVGLDMALVQIYASQGGAELASPDFLQVTSRDPASLVGQHVTIVGHPEGRLKKWTDGVGVDAFGAWFATSAYILPGDSGSPVLDDEGALVGIIHRSPTGEDLVSGDGYDNDSIGTASAELTMAMSAPLPAVVISTAASTSTDAAVKNDLVYLNGGADTVTVAGAPESVLSLLGAACDAALARTDFVSPDDLTSAEQPCYDAMAWIECRVDESPRAYPTVCPTADFVAWTARFQKMNDLSVAMNGNTYLYPLFTGLASLAPTKSQGASRAQGAVLAALGAASQPLDFAVANYLAAVGATQYGGVNLVDYVKGYASKPDYYLFGTSIASSALWLADNGQMSADDATVLLEALHADPDVSVGTKLYVEEVLYESGKVF